ncbi:hypothetical protein [Marinobacter changyiensis]|uniref:hypothetical protein n=1 Tax=Marinobacter changyiensis TaxID=2604091 RepID=UPI00126507F4|nr:hypothetical protein [Marinobacter changyiensis]
MVNVILVHFTRQGFVEKHFCRGYHSKAKKDWQTVISTGQSEQFSTPLQYGLEKTSKMTTMRYLISAKQAPYTALKSATL